jgi:hypothetical protein
MENKDTSDEILVFEGILIDIEKTKESVGNRPAGYLFFKDFDKKITVWDKGTLGRLNINGLYKIIYTYKKSGIYENYTLKEILDKNVSVDMKNKIPTWELMGYPVLMDENIKEIKLPRKVFDFILQLKRKE